MTVAPFHREPPVTSPELFNGELKCRGFLLQYRFFNKDHYHSLRRLQRLFNLRQGTDSVAEYAIEFWTLAVDSKWNKEALQGAPSPEEHESHVRQVLRLLENKLYIKAEKCEFHKQSVPFLGFIVESGQVKADPRRSGQLQNGPRPLPRPTVYFSCLESFFCTALGASVSLSSGFHSQSNGQTESANQDLEASLHCVAAQHRSSWAKHLPWIEYAHNSLTTSATVLSPFEVALGYQPPLFPAQEKELAVPSVQENLHRCHKVWSDAREALLRSEAHHQRQIVAPTSVTYASRPAAVVVMPAHHAQAFLPSRLDSRRKFWTHHCLPTSAPIQLAFILPCVFCPWLL
ncbi:uncharacterized protein LOC118496344 [Sander lucioperca]|uniref:uncharacterized protein LOC118496344 n=1 Tax=Sander lucioperca TaxID=283035 RepID=UPI0016535F25|nr:uncharacterized protein LOC118496344 [Sander lucioperca]